MIEHDIDGVGVIRSTAILRSVELTSQLQWVATARKDKDPFHGTRHYVAVGDLRPYGYEVVLHAHCKHAKGGNHKLELMETGNKSFRELVSEINRVFVVDPMQLGVMRVDLTADVVGIPVPFFQDALRAAYKQVANDIEKADQFSRLGRGDVQTLYLGSRPNCFRIGDRTFPGTTFFVL